MIMIMTMIIQYLKKAVDERIETERKKLKPGFL